MRAPAVSFAKRFFAAFVAALLAFTIVPASAFAGGEGDTADIVAGEPQGVSAEQVDEGSGSTPAASPADGGTLASVLVGTPTTFINSDVALDGEPIVGSFTVDGLTFAVTEGSDVELVGVSPDWQQVADSQEGDGSPVAPMLASGPDGGDSTFAAPESITYDGVDYTVTSIGAYAFYLSGVASVELPASIAQVDDRAFRSSDVASVTVAEGNATYSSFDGALYDAEQLSLLLIPEGKQGTVLLPKTAESAAPSVFSHCPLVTQVSVEEGSAAFASENGLLYTSDLTTLLRVPAGATDITIRDGCTTIAAGAMEACAKLTTITAPASVTSISPDVFTSVPTVSLPAVAAVADDPGASTGATEGSSEQAGSAPALSSASTQLTAMVALSSTDDDLPGVDSSAITVSLPKGADGASWNLVGLSNLAWTEGLPMIGEDAFQQSTAYAADVTVTINMNYGDAYIDEAGTRKSLHVTTNTYAVILSSGRAWHNSGSPVILSDIRRTGYSFQGWSTNRNCSPTDAAGMTVYKSNGSITVYAIWAPIVTLNMNGGDAYIDEAGSKKSVHDTVNNYAVILAQDSRGAWHNSGERHILSSPTRTGYSFAGWSTNSACSASNATGYTVYWNSGPQTYYAIWSANSYTVEYWNKAGTTQLSSDTGFKYDAARTLAAKPSSGVSTGYDAVGWSTLTGQSTASYGFGTSQKNLATGGTLKLYLAEKPNTYTMSFNANGGSGTVPNSISATYDQSYSITVPSLIRVGYTFDGWATGATESKAYEKDGPFKNLTATANGTVTLYAHWSANTYTVTFDSAGGTEASSISAVYDQEIELPAPTRQGYAFSGWLDGVTGTTYGAGKAKNLTAADKGTVKLIAQWAPVISADVPSAVTARVDVLGIEEQEEAAAYIESRCGEPLQVTEVAFEPLAGASELFGADASQVSLEAYAGSAADPVFSLPLHQASYLMDTVAFRAFRMAAYGTRVPISYRFVIPDELLLSLVETEKPVCTVAYTVALA